MDMSVKAVTGFFFALLQANTIIDFFNFWLGR